MKPDLLIRALTASAQCPDFSLRDWETLLGQARRARLDGRLAMHFRDNGWLTSLPLGPRRHLESALRLVDRQQHEVRWEVDCLRRALLKFPGPVVLLKGAAYVISGLPPGKARLFSDIDIMVARQQIPAAETALLAEGWISDERDAYNQRYYRQWMHEVPPLRHVRRNTSIDLHHTITPPTSRFHVEGGKLLASAKPLSDQPQFHVLSPADMVLHSAVHLFQEGEFSHGLRDLLDLNDLLLHFSEDASFWQILLDRADEIGLQIPLFHALVHLQRLTGISAPQHLQSRVATMAPNPVARRAMAWLLELALRPDHPSCDSRWTGFARWLLYVRSHALRMPMHLLIPHLLRKSWMQRFPKEAS